MANIHSAATFRKTRRNEKADLFPEPRDQMHNDREVWLRLLGEKGYLAYLYLTTEAALRLALVLLENVRHRHDVEDAIDVLIVANKASLIESVYQEGPEFRALFEAIVGKGAEVIEMNPGKGDRDGA